MKSSQQLREERAQIWAAQQELMKRAESRGDNKMLPDEEAQWDRYETDFAEISRQIDRSEAYEARLADDASRKGETLKAPITKTEEEQIEEYKRVFWRFQKGGAQSLTADEIDLVSRAQTTISGSAGGYTVPKGFSNELHVEMALWGSQLDICRVIRTESGNQIEWPTADDTGNTGAILAETVAIGEQDVAFGQKLLDAYTYTSKLVRVQRQLLQDTYFNLEEELRMMFGRRLGTAMNAHFTTGTGTSQPNGFVTASTVGKTTASNSTVTGAELIDLIHSVNPVYRRNARFVLNDASLAVIKKLTIGTSGADNRPLWSQSLIPSDPSTILGYPYTINPDMASFGAAAKPIGFGDFSYYIIRLAGDPIMQRLEERYADYLQVGFLAFQRADGEQLSTGAIKMLRNPTT